MTAEFGCIILGLMFAEAPTFRAIWLATFVLIVKLATVFWPDQADGAKAFKALA